MEASSWVAIIVATVAVIPAVLAYLNSRKTIAVQDKKVDADAYARAQRIYEIALNQIEDQLKRLRNENAELIALNNRLQIQLNQLEILVAKMRRQLLEAGIPPPTE